MPESRKCPAQSRLRLGIFLAEGSPTAVLDENHSHVAFEVAGLQQHGQAGTQRADFGHRQLSANGSLRVPQEPHVQRLQPDCIVR